MDAKAGDGSSTINLVVPTGVLQNGKYVTVWVPFSYALSWTPLPASIGLDEDQETKLSIDSFKVPQDKYNWSVDMGLYDGWLEESNEAPPEPTGIPHFRAQGAGFNGLSIGGYGAEAARGRATKKSVTWALRINPDPGEKQVVTLRVFGQAVNGRGSAAIYLYYEYTYHE